MVWCLWLIFLLDDASCLVCFHAVLLVELGGFAVISRGEHQSVRYLCLGRQVENAVVGELPV